MGTTIYITIGLIATVSTIYFVVKYKEFRKFLSGAFFVSGGVQLYFYLAHISIPLWGTDFVQTPEIAGLRCIPHLILSALCFYFGFIKK